MRLQLFFLYILILFSLVTGMPVDGQFMSRKLPKATRFSNQNGLSHTHVNVNFIDSRGFLWVGTQDGLNRFDGYGFKTYRHRPSDSTSLSNNNIHSIAEDSKGTIWIGTGSGLNSYNPHTGKFRHYNDIWPDPVGIPNEIKTVYCVEEGFVWILNNEYLARFQPDSMEIELYDFHQEPGYSPSAKITTSLILDRNGRFWFGTEKGLYSFNRINSEFKRYLTRETNDTSLNAKEIYSIFEDSDGELWTGTSSGLNKFDRLQNRFKIYGKPGNTNHNNPINSICEDNDGNLWLAGDNGLIHFDKRSGQMFRADSLMIENSRVKIGKLRTLVCDDSDILWAGGMHGLMKIDLKPPKFELYNTAKTSFAELSGENVSAILKENSTLWVGYRSKGLDRIDLRTGKVKHYTSAEGLSDENILHLYRDSKHRIWISTSKAVDILTPEKGEIRKFEDVFKIIPVDILEGRQIFTVLEDERGFLWMGTDKGLFEMRDNTETVNLYDRIYNEDQSFIVGEVYDLSLDKYENLWMATDKGLLMYDPEKNIFEKINIEPQYSWLQFSPVYSLLNGSEGKLWIGSSYGLSVYDPDNNDIVHFSETNGLANSFIYTILEDLESNIWVSTNKGLSKFNRVSRKFSNYSKKDGLQPREFNRGAGFVSSDGEMFFGGLSGLNGFCPDQIKDNLNVPDIAITACEVIDASGISEIPVGKNTTLVRIHDNQSLSFHFSALDFTFPAHNTYKYSLQELRKPDHWLNLGQEHSVTISGLSSGEYIFKVMGSNNDGIWNPAERSMRIIVDAPFWDTRIAYIIYFFGLLLAFYLILQYRIQGLKKSNRLLREKENASLEVARQKDLLSKRNKNIEDSLKYAQRIQSAMLDTPRLFKKHLPDSFILHKPKDIVSGDFYWISEMGGQVYVAAVDCTGHGVPGAFMSVIGFELFRKIINMQDVSDPGEILNKLNKSFEEIFGEDNDISLRDGMDLSFCVFDKNEMVLRYAGAFNPLYIVRHNKLIEVKGDRMSIGADSDPGVEDKSEKKFTSHVIDLEKDDMIYLFSDGYADQFGGPEGKKFKYRRFRHLLLTIHQLPLARQMNFLNDSIEEWRGEIEQIDDILVIGIKANFKKSSS